MTTPALPFAPADTPRPAGPLSDDRLRHDVASPLAVITGFAELLASEREFSEADRREFAERIAAAAEEIRVRLAEDR